MSDLGHGDSTEASLPFVYDSLQPGQVRLVRVDDCSSGRVKCHIGWIDLETFDSPFFALSYVWGSEEANQEIILNGKIFHVTPNLLAALTAFDAFQNRENLVVLIWIDAIAINQNDPQEKSAQVPLMGRIFGKAGMVMIWLGQLNDGEQTFVEVLKWLSAHAYLEEIGHLERHSEQATKSLQVLRAEHGLTVVQLRTLYIFLNLVEAWVEGSDAPGEEDFNEFLQQCPHRTDLPPPRHPFWVSFLLYMHNAWFQRIWTRQEVWLAHRRVLLHPEGTANYHVMQRFRDAFYGQNRSPLWGGGFPHYKVMKKRGYSRDQIRASLTKVHVPIKPYLPETLQLTLLEIAGLRATIAKDYIYGLVGLMDDETRSQLRVDYSASDASVFAQAVRVACSQKDGARMLPTLWGIYSVVESTLEGLPTWCPDFSNSWNSVNKLHSSSFPLWKQVKASYQSMARVDCDCPDMSIRFAGVQLALVNRSVENSPLFSYEDFYTALEEQDLSETSHSLFTERNVSWLRALYNFCVEDRDRSTDTLRSLDEFFPALPGPEIPLKLTQRRLEHGKKRTIRHYVMRILQLSTWRTYSSASTAFIYSRLS
jgi:hypothetical protein